MDAGIGTSSSPVVRAEGADRVLDAVVPSVGGDADTLDAGIGTSLLPVVVCVLARPRTGAICTRHLAANSVNGRQYGEELELSLQDLSARLARGAYRASPVRRVYVPKPSRATWVTRSTMPAPSACWWLWEQRTRSWRSTRSATRW